MGTFPMGRPPGRRVGDCGRPARAWGQGLLAAGPVPGVALDPWPLVEAALIQYGSIALAGPGAYGLCKGTRKYIVAARRNLRARPAFVAVQLELGRGLHVGTCPMEAVVGAIVSYMVLPHPPEERNRPFQPPRGQGGTVPGEQPGRQLSRKNGRIALASMPCKIRSRRPHPESANNGESSEIFYQYGGQGVRQMSLLHDHHLLAEHEYQDHAAGHSTKATGPILEQGRALRHGLFPRQF